MALTYTACSMNGLHPFMISHIRLAVAHHARTHCPSVARLSSYAAHARRARQARRSVKWSMQPQMHTGSVTCCMERLPAHPESRCTTSTHISCHSALRHTRFCGRCPGKSFIAQQVLTHGSSSAPSRAHTKEMYNQNSQGLDHAAFSLGLQTRKTGVPMEEVMDPDSIPSLVDMLSRPDSQQHAVKLLMGLSEDSNNRAAIASDAGAIPALVVLLRHDDFRVQNCAAMALWNLAMGNREGKAAIMSAGAIPQLAEMCNSNQPAVQLSAASAICGIAAGNSQLETLIATVALPILVRLLAPTTQSGSPVAVPHEHRNVIPHEVRLDEVNVPIGLQYAAVRTLHETLQDPSHRPGVMRSMQLALGVPQRLTDLVPTAHSIVKVPAIKLFHEFQPQQQPYQLWLCR